MTTLVWFRQDLRIKDNPALFEAARNGRVLPVFILEPAEQAGETHPLGGASLWWLHHSLASLKADLPGLIFLRGARDTCSHSLQRKSGPRPSSGIDATNHMQSSGTPISRRC